MRKMPKVLNKYFDKIPKDAVYIGRGSIYGNPFIIGKNGNRKQCISKYAKYIIPRFSEEQLQKLKNKDLVCYCKPLSCHGDILLDIVNRKKRR